MRILGYATTTVILAVISSIWRGYVLSVIWRWFMVAAFGVPQLGIATAIGLSLIVSFLTDKVDRHTNEKSWGELLAEGFASTLLSPLLTLGIAWVVHLFV